MSAKSRKGICPSCYLKVALNLDHPPTVAPHLDRNERECVGSYQPALPNDGSAREIVIHPDLAEQAVRE